jgi:hypothetical protein
MGAIPLLAAGLSPAEVTRAAGAARAALDTSFTPAFFTPHEYATARMLAELVIPRDGRSGGALDAGVPVFMDFILAENPGMQTPMRGGLAWLDTESRERFGAGFVEIQDVQRRAILTTSWSKGKPEHCSGLL